VQRRAVVSALTILGLGGMFARYASYADLARVIRERFTDARRTLRELFARVTFNIVVGNNDDHARNHAAFWDGASTYPLSEPDAHEIIDHQVQVIESERDDVCDRAGMSAVERRYFWRRQFPNSYAMEGYTP